MWRKILPWIIISGFILNAAFIYESITGTTSLHSALFMLMVIHAIYVGVLVADSCQRFENESEHIYIQICSLPWHTWNLRNRKLYLILLCGTLRPVRIHVAGQLVINYNFASWVIEKAFALANALYSLNKRRLAQN